MPHITVDLNNAVCPDYTSPNYMTHREALVNNSSMPELVAQYLTMIWNSTHIIDVAFISLSLSHLTLVLLFTDFSHFYW